MKIPESAINEINNRIEITEVIGRYLQLRRVGSKYVGLCPFHNEKTPSFSVDPDRRFWYCFGCKQGGNIFQFLMKMEGMGFPEAVRKLAEEAGVEIKWENDSSKQDTTRQRYLQLLDRVCKYYSHVLFETGEGAPGREYLLQRRISKSVAEKFRLGFAPSNAAPLLKIVHEAGFSDEELVNCGIFVRKERGVRELLSGRLIFPIADFQGRAIAMGGRILGTGLPKYINSPETEVYSKRCHLYGLNVARGPISRENRAIVVEGYLDVISMHQIGFDCCVASLGTALTTEQAKLLKRYATQVILAYDGDSAGAKAIIKANDVLEEEGLQVVTVVWPDGEDPDSMAARGRLAVEEVLKEKIGIVKFVIQRQLKLTDTTTPEGKENLVKLVLPFIEKIQDSVRRDAYVRELAYYSGFSESKLALYLRRRKHKIDYRSFSEPKLRTRLLNTEEKLFSLCTAHPEWLEQVKKIISPSLIDDEYMRHWFEKLWLLDKQDGPISVTELLGEGASEDDCAKLTEIMAYDRLDSNFEDAIQLASNIRNENLKKSLDRIKYQMFEKMASGNMTEDDPLYLEYMNLQKILRG